MDKLKYKVCHDSGFVDDPFYLDKILEWNGVEDPQAFLEKQYPYHEPSLLRRMSKAVEIGLKIADGSIIHVGMKVDPDVDGFTSAAAMHLILTALNSSISVDTVMPSGKEHGFPSTAVFDEVPYQLRYPLFIMPDAGSDQVSFDYYSIHSDLQILVLDHHPYDYQMIPPNCVMVNCRDEQYPNETLTGVGVVYKYYEALCAAIDPRSEVGMRLSAINKQLLQLVALGMVADVADLRNLETRGYVLDGIVAINEDLEALQKGEDLGRPYSLMAEILNKSAYSVPHGATIMSLGWYVAPPINAMIRLGDWKDKLKVYDALCFVNQDVEYQPRRKRKEDPKPELQILSCQNNAARLCRNIKVKQDKLTNSGKKKYMQMISQESVNKDSFIIVKRNASDETPPTLTGLIANKLAATYRRPVLLVTEDESGVCAGSGRGYDKAGIEDFKGLLAATDRCEMLAGHPNAFGIKVHSSEIPVIQEAINKAMPLDQMEVSYTVDFEVDARKLTSELVEEVGDLYALWGNHVDEPQFALINIRLRPNEIESHDDGRFINFKFNDVLYSKPYCKHGEFEDITQRSNRHRIGPEKDLELVVIGTFQTKERDGKKYSFVDIKEWWSQEIVDFDPDDF